MSWSRQKKLSARQVFIYIMTGAFVCLLIPHEVTDKLDHVLGWAVTPFTKTGRGLSLQVTDKLRQDAPMALTQKEYQILLHNQQQQKIKIANLEQELKRYKEINVILSGLRQDFGQQQATFISSLVTGDDSSNIRDVSFLNRGSLHQVEKGQIALSPFRVETVNADGEGEALSYLMAVVGKIEDSSLKTSRLQLLSDPDFCLKVTIVPHWSRQENWHTNGMLYGHGMSRISVSMISTDFPVQPGDIVLARKEARYLPVNMVIGTVQSCTRKKDPPLEWEITVKPYADLYHLNDIYIVKI